MKRFFKWLRSLIVKPIKIPPGMTVFYEPIAPVKFKSGDYWLEVKHSKVAGIYTTDGDEWKLNNKDKLGKHMVKHGSKQIIQFKESFGM